LLATEDPRNACSVVSAVIGAPPRTPVCYEKGVSGKGGGVDARRLLLFGLGGAVE